MAGHHKLRHCFTRLALIGSTGEIFLLFKDGQWYQLGPVVPQTWPNFQIQFTGAAHVGAQFNDQWFLSGAVATSRARKVFAEYGLTRVGSAPAGVTDTISLGDPATAPTDNAPGISNYPNPYS